MEKDDIEFLEFETVRLQEGPNCGCHAACGPPWLTSLSAPEPSVEDLRIHGVTGLHVVAQPFKPRDTTRRSEWVVVMFSDQSRIVPEILVRALLEHGRWDESQIPYWNPDKTAPTRTLLAVAHVRPKGRRSSNPFPPGSTQWFELRESRRKEAQKRYQEKVRALMQEARERRIREQ